MLLDDFLPQSKLVVNETKILKPRFPIIDAHNHLGEEFGGGWINRPTGELLALMDEAGIEMLVDLDGGWGESVLQAHLDKLKSAAPERFQVFGGVHWSAWAEKGQQFPEYAARRLAAQAGWGAQGLKIWKPFGLTVKDDVGQRVAVD